MKKHGYATWQKIENDVKQVANGVDNSGEYSIISSMSGWTITFSEANHKLKLHNLRLDNPLPVKDLIGCRVFTLVFRD